MVKSGDKLHIGGRKWVVIMFMGQYEHTIDTKGRIIIPAKYRNELGDTFVITKGLDGCLFIYPSQEWIDFADKLMGLSSSQNTRRLQRQFLSKAMEVTTDKQGRITYSRIVKGECRLGKRCCFSWYDEPYRSMGQGET